MKHKEVDNKKQLPVSRTVIWQISYSYMADLVRSYGRSRTVIWQTSYGYVADIEKSFSWAFGHVPGLEP